MRRLYFLVFGFAVLAPSAVSKPDFPVKIQKLLSSKSVVGCETCHNSPPKRNAFGDFLDDILVDLSSKTVDQAVLAELENSDFDKDGKSDAEELRAGSNPSVAAKPEENPEPAKPLVPRHTFHPAIVHFPIALLIAAIILEFLGKWRNKPSLNQAGRINAALGALSTLPSVATGIIAMYRMGFEVSGTMLNHLLAAAACTIFACAAWFMRKKSSYIWFLSLSALAAFVAGFFGGELVYGS